MSWPETRPSGSNTITGVDELVIQIVDIMDADFLAEQVLELGDKASKIVEIFIYESDNTGFSYFVKQANGDLAGEDNHSERNHRVYHPFSRSDTPPSVKRWELATCAPLITILDTIRRYNGGLQLFFWAAEHISDRMFTRPPAFWTALCGHALTLRSVYIDFFRNEVQDVTPLPLGIRFPALQRLHLDTTTAFGDDGRFIDAFLHGSPNLEHLTFLWPMCHIDKCRMHSVSWAWTLPKLWFLRVSGSNFTPATYSEFLVRHPTITSLVEQVEGPWIVRADGRPVEV